MLKIEYITDALMVFMLIYRGYWKRACGFTVIQIVQILQVPILLLLYQYAPYVVQRTAYNSLTLVDIILDIIAIGFCLQLRSLLPVAILLLAQFYLTPIATFAKYCLVIHDYEDWDFAKDIQFMLYFHSSFLINLVIIAICYYRPYHGDTSPERNTHEQRISTQGRTSQYAQDEQGCSRNQSPSAAATATPTG